MEVLKSVKTKPPEVVSLVWPPLRVACGRHHQKVLLVAQGLGGILFPCAGVLVAFLSAQCLCCRRLIAPSTVSSQFMFI
jgi:hypothetical protein